MKILFQFLSGARAGQTVEVPAKPAIKLGRRPDNDVVFDAQRDLDVSGFHAELRQEGDGFYLCDVGSANGTFAGGARVTRLRVVDGQEFSMGPHGPRVAVRLLADGPAPAVAPPVAASAPVAPPPGAMAPGATPGEQAAAALPGDRKVGSRTVAMMIDAALLQARTSKSGGLGKSTVFFRSMVNQAVTKSTRGFKIAIALLVLVLLGAVGGFLALRHFERQEAVASQQELRHQVAELMKRQTGAASDGEKEQLAKRIEDLNRKLAQATPAAAGRAIVKRHLQAVYLLAYRKPTGEAKGYCTAFAVDERMLATNAHCVVALQRFERSGLKSFVVMNRMPAARHEILRAVPHPRYHPPVSEISPDVGLLQVAARLPAQVRLADEPALREIDSGDTMYTYGFPGRLAVVASPSATLVQGVVGRVTKLNGDLGPFSETQLLQHSAFTAGGTSGSPIFNAAGDVIAVNAGGYVEPGTMQIMNPVTGRASNLQVAKQLAGYNFGIRIDVLKDLIARYRRGEVAAPAAASPSGDPAAPAVGPPGAVPRPRPENLPPPGSLREE